MLCASSDKLVISKDESEVTLDDGGRKAEKRIISLSSILISRSLGLYLAVNLFGNVPFGSCFHAVYTHEQRGVCVCNSTRLQVSQSNQGPHFFFLFSFHV